MKENFKYIILIVLFTIIAVPITFQNDTFFYITTGDSILQNGFYNIENTTIHEGLEYKTIHPFFDIIFSLIYKYLGFVGIHIFVVLIAIITMVSIFSILLKLKVPKIMSFVSTIIILYLGRTVFTGRSQIISFLLMIYMVYFIEKLLKTNKNKYIILILLMQLIIVNFHTYIYIYILTFLMYIPYIFEYIIRKMFKIKDGERKYKLTFENYNIKKIIISIILGILVGLMNPYGIYSYTYLFITLGGTSSNYISELQMPTIFESIIMIVYITLVFVPIFFNKTKVRVLDFLMVMMYVACSFLAIRYGYYLIFLTYISITRYILDFIKSNSLDTFASLEKFKFTLKPMLLSTVLILVLFIGIICDQINSKFLEDELYPMQATEWIKENLDYKNIRMYNHFNYGSYIAFKNIPIFIDSRSELFDSNGVTVLKDLVQLENMTTTLDEFIEKYNLEYALVKKDEKIYQYIAKDNKNIKLYEDEFYEIYKLKSY